MTFLATDGKYIVADLRVNSSVLEQEPFFNLTGDVDAPGHVDGYEKIWIIPSRYNIYLDINQERERIEALAMAGEVSFFTEFKEYVNTYDSLDIRFDQLLERVTQFFRQPSGELLGVTNKAKSLKVPMTSRRWNTINLGQTDVIAMAGSGISAVRSNMDLLEIKPTLEEMIFLASKVDLHCSASYSVYGVEEKTYFRSVVPSQKYINDKLTKLIGTNKYQLKGK